MFAVVILLFFLLVPAAQPTETWYWGLRDGELISFNANGEEQGIADSNGEPEFGWRFDAETALYITEDIQDVTHLYRLTAEAATEIPLPDEREFTQPRRVLDHAGDYVVLWASDSGVLPSPGILVNATDATAELLTGDVARVAYFAGSKDAPDVLRYFSVNPDEDRWTLLERDLASGDEHEIHAFEADERETTFLTANSDGSQWIYLLRDEDRNLVSTLVNADGTTEILDDGTAESAYGWQFLGDTQLGIEMLCEVDCQIILRDGDAEQTFTVPEASLNLSVLARPETKSILVYNHGSEFVLVNENNELLSLGSFNSRWMYSGNNVLSPDERYLFSTFADEDEPDSMTFFVTDLTDGIPVLTGESSLGAGVSFFERGVIMTEYDRPTTASAYLYADDRVVELPNADRGSYFDILADGTLLYQQNTSESGGQGIYRYNPTNQSFTLLVDATRLLYAQPLP